MIGLGIASMTPCWDMLLSDCPGSTIDVPFIKDSGPTSDFFGLRLIGGAFGSRGFLGFLTLTVPSGFSAGGPSCLTRGTYGAFRTYFLFLGAAVVHVS